MCLKTTENSTART